MGSKEILNVDISDGSALKENSLLLVHLREEEQGADDRLSQVLSYALTGVKYDTAGNVEEFESYVNQNRCRQSTGDARTSEMMQRRIIFAIPLGISGINLEFYRLIRFLRSHPGFLDGFVGGVLIDSKNDLYSKSASKDLVFAANLAGCAFVGRPLVEGTRTLSNYIIIARNLGTDLMSAYRESAAELVKEVLETNFEKKECPKLLVLHASSHKTSNTYAIWNRIKEKMFEIGSVTGAETGAGVESGIEPGIEIEEIGLRNGTLSDCSGCPYKMCLHFGERGSCFYGGVMVEDVYPAVRRADAVLMLCPNYNDALSANMTAFINRLTSLFRTTRFYDKAIFGIVVSGYSGSDIVAGQLIAALNMNKTFYLPGNFAMMETANDAGTAMKLPGIEERMDAFAHRIMQTIKK